MKVWHCVQFVSCPVQMEFWISILVCIHLLMLLDSYFYLAEILAHVNMVSLHANGRIISPSKLSRVTNARYYTRAFTGIFVEYDTSAGTIQYRP